MDLLGLSVRWPILGAPMAGGPSTPALTAAVTGAGGLGFLAGGYLSASSLESDISDVRGLGVTTFGVNLFVPGSPEVDEAAVSAYLDSLAPEAEEFGVEVAASWDDDHWNDKLELLTHHPVPVVSFTFGAPAPEVVSRLQHAGSRVVITVTTPDEAARAARVGADAVCAQGIEAGGHQGSFSDDVSLDTGWGLLALVTAIGHEVQIPVIATGGVMSGSASASL
jgi:nitronate monooxygenase